VISDEHIAGAKAQILCLSLRAARAEGLGRELFRVRNFFWKREAVGKGSGLKPLFHRVRFRGWRFLEEFVEGVVAFVDEAAKDRHGTVSAQNIFWVMGLNLYWLIGSVVLCFWELSDLIRLVGGAIVEQ